MKTRGPDLTTPAALEALIRATNLLRKAEREALAQVAPGTDPAGLVMAELSLEAGWLNGLALSLLPDGIDLGADQHGDPTGEDPRELIRQAELATRQRPIHEFSPGTTALVAALNDTIRDRCRA
ncbi:hypothetical protein [uncultured Serinicoccus sp.]|uniref:hypothetical protein n=1 Tax=uncultured Serinicoccus sp. TaxID=735514 RepID=UPI002603066C|nr:hypothetical protein [uncultured Serinicoccus sp.]